MEIKGTMNIPFLESLLQNELYMSSLALDVALQKCVIRVDSYIAFEFVFFLLFQFNFFFINRNKIFFSFYRELVEHLLPCERINFNELFLHGPAISVSMTFSKSSVIYP